MHCVAGRGFIITIEKTLYNKLNSINIKLNSDYNKLINVNNKLIDIN